MSANGISTLSTKELRQKAKLNLAAINRAADGNPRATYDITQLPTQYSGNTVVDNANVGGLVQGRPWVAEALIPVVLSLDAGNPASYSSGSTWTDTVSNIAFTLYGSPVYSASNGGYLTFVPGSGQYASSTASLATLTNWTMEVWHYYTGNNTGSNPCIVSEKFTAGNINFMMGTLDGANLQAGYFTGGFHTTTGTTLTANNWYHIVGTYDGTTIKMYVNGTLVQQAASAVAPLHSGSGINLMRRWDNLDLWGGRLSVVRIYSGAITATKVTNNFNAEKSRYGL